MSTPDHPSAEELSKKFGKTITSQMIRKAKHPLWSPDDNERLGKLFSENGAEKTLNWYQQQFKPKQKQFVEIQLSYLTKDDRSKMPQYERVWT